MNELTAAFFDGVRALFYSIDSLVYKLVIYLYNLFDMLSRGRLLENDFMQDLSFRVGLILGLVMLFRVVFSLIQMLLSPDTMNDKEKGVSGLAKRVLITVVLLGVVPSVFSLAYRVQDILLGNNSSGTNVISKLLLPSGVTFDKASFGGTFASSIFFTFYDSENFGDEPPVEVDTCQKYQAILRSEIVHNESFDFGRVCLNEKILVENETLSSQISGEDEELYIMRYNYLFSTIVGIMICWFLLTYCFSVGVRVIQLAFLQIVSPMAIISYISPKKDNMFSKWGQMCITTYLDVFIRVAIINFVVLIVAMIMDAFYGESGGMGLFFSTTGVYNYDSPWYARFLVIIIILALLQFAKKAPELLKELLPKSSGAAAGDFGFGLKNRGPLGGALAAVGGAAVGGAVGLFTERGLYKASGFAIGFGRGMLGGFKKGDSLGAVGKTIGDVGKKQSQWSKSHIDMRNNGSRFLGRFGQRLDNAFGIMGPAEEYENQLASIDRKIAKKESEMASNRAKVKALQSVSDYKSQMESRAEKKLLGSDLSNKKGLSEIQKNLLTAQANLEKLKSNGSNASPDEISAAQIAFNDVKKKAIEEYITACYKNHDLDGGMYSFISSLDNVIKEDSTGAFSNFTPEQKKLEDYRGLDELETAFSNEKTQMSNVLANSDAYIQSRKDEKSEITSSEGYRRAIANRNAVGGHNGKKN